MSGYHEDVRAEVDRIDREGLARFARLERGALKIRPYRMGYAKPQASEMVQRLEGRGWIDSPRSSGDCDDQSIKLTRAGWAQLGEVPPWVK